MARSRRAAPDWQDKASNRADELRDTFHKNIRTIAESMASHERAEFVLQRHVDEASESLARIGMNRRPWYRRPEVEVSIGVALFGIGAAMPDVCAGLCGDSEPVKWVARAVMLAFFAGGVLCWIHGWARGSGKV